MKLKEPGQYWWQCGKYANVVFDNYAKGKHFWDSLAQKKTFINSQVPVPGAMIIVDSHSAYWHIAIVKEVYNDWTILINDSNSKHTEIVNEYVLDPNDQVRPRPGGKWTIEWYYIPYTHFFHIVVDREWNAKLLRDVPEWETPMIWLIGNHWREPTDKQLAKTRTLVKKISLPAYEKQDEYCTTKFHTGMLKKFQPLALPTPEPAPVNTGVISERMYFTYYNVWDVSQNDSSPCRWAWSNVVWDLCKLANQWVRTMALVRPKRDQYDAQFWDTVVLKWDKGCSWSFIVADEMNKRYRYQDHVCTKKPWTNLCIRWDIAMPLWVHWWWGSCYISDIIRK
jgi:surface antigen